MYSLIIPITLALLPSIVGASSPRSYDEDIRQIGETADAIVQQATQPGVTPAPGRPHLSPAALHAIEQAQQTRGHLLERNSSSQGSQSIVPRGQRQEAPSAATPNPAGAVVYLLTTFPDLEDSLTGLSADIGALRRKDANRVVEAHVLVRGLLPGHEQIGETIRSIQPIVSAFQSSQRDRIEPGYTPLDIQVALNPNPFRTFEAGDFGPLLVIVEPDGTIRRGKGTVSVTEVIRRTAAEGDAGVLGPLTAFVERNLLDEIQDRIAKLDAAAIKKGAQDRLWSRLSQPQVDLPMATDPEIFELDLSFELTTPMTDQNGQVLIPAGTRFNPMEHMPFTRRVVIFNPEREEELDRVTHHLAGLSSGRENVRLIATHFRTPSTLQAREAQQQLERRFNLPVYLLDRQMLARFAVKKTPTVITGDNHRKLILVETIVAKDG